MRFAIPSGLMAVAAAAAITAPAQAQAAPAPTISGGPCQVRRSGEGRGFTFASCLISVANGPQGKAITVDYKSNPKTYNPHAEFGSWSKTPARQRRAEGRHVRLPEQVRRAGREELQADALERDAGRGRRRRDRLSTRRR